MPLRLHVWITRLFTLLLTGVLLLDIAPMAGAGPAGWLGILLILLVWLAFEASVLNGSSALSCPLCGRSYGPHILFRMSCPHCGAEAPRKARSPRIIWVPTLLLTALLVGAGLYCRPLEFPDLTQVEGPIQLTYIHDLPPLIEDYIARPQDEMKRLTLEPDGPECRAAAQVLSRYRYRRCLQTLRKSTSIEHLGEDTFYFNAADLDELDLNLFSCRHMWNNGRVYHIGWYGDKQGQRLGAELAQALGLL